MIKTGLMKKYQPGLRRSRSGLATLGIGIFLFCAPGTALSPGLGAESPEGKREALERKASELLSMNPAMARQRIGEMNLQDALSVYDLLLRDAREKGVGPQVFYVVEQIQLLKATEASQKRLESLIWVLALTLLLFSVYLAYVLIDQRRIYNKMLALRKGSSGGPMPGNRDQRNPEPEVYRGE